MSLFQKIIKGIINKVPKSLCEIVEKFFLVLFKQKNYMQQNEEKFKNRMKILSGIKE
jgi:beta-xylosidase